MHLFDVLQINDLLKIHSLLTNKDTSTFRTTKVWGNDLKNAQDKIEFSDGHSIKDDLKHLNQWYIDSPDHVLIKSCAYIVAFINIHPFTDGNGRVSRYVLTALMSKYDDKLRYFPFEELLSDMVVKKLFIKLSQDMRKIFNSGNKDDNCYRIIYFLLSVLRNKLKEVVTGAKPATIFN